MKIVEPKVDLIQIMGTEDTIVDAARVSFSKRAKDYSPEKNIKLINYLAKNNHWTPFSHCVATFQIKAPIFVARQLMRHTVGLTVNETSRRYVDEEPEFFFPKREKGWRARAENVKQGSDSSRFIDVFEYGHDYVENIPQDAVEVCLEAYERLLKKGVAPEQARMILPQNTMTEWWWTGSLAAWTRVFNLRLDPHTQKETQDVVQMAYDQLLPHFPNALGALVNV
jgi:thymidylate synthase (FAD)